MRRNKMHLLAAAALSIGCAGPALAADVNRGFDAAVVRDFATNGGAHRLPPIGPAERERLLALTKAANAFRGMMAGDIESLRAALDEDERALLGLIDDPADAIGRAVWTYFFQGSVIAIGHGMAETSRIGFYNPIVDGWILADFRRSASGGHRLAALEGALGETLRGVRGRELEPPEWTQTPDAPLALALGRTYARAVAAFEAAYPPLAATPPQRRAGAGQTTLVRGRVLLLGSTVASLEADPAYKAAVDRLERAIAAGDPGALRALVTQKTAVPVQRVTAVPAAVRALLRPTGAYRGPGGFTVTLGTPYTGRLVVFADLGEPAGGGEPWVDNLLLLDLAQAEGASR